MVATAPDSFEVTWKDPADAGATWIYDPMHFPRPLAPITGEFLDREYSKYMSARTIFVNGFAFSSAIQPRPPTPDIIRRGALDVWMNDNLPRIQEWCRRIRHADYDSMTLAQLGEAIEKLMTEAVDTFGLTMTVITGFMGPTFGLVQFLEQQLGPRGVEVAATLLQGFENGTAAAGAGLGELAEAAMQSPEVARALRESRYEEIGSLPGGPGFLDSLSAYLEEYGWRVESWGLLHQQTWAEDPRVPLMLVGRYVADPARSPLTSIRRSVEQREEAIRDVEGSLSADDTVKFRSMLETAKDHVPISEGRALWQLIIIGSMRVPLLALGRKLVEAGALARAEDVFFLSSEEMQQAAARPDPSTRELATGRHADHDRWEKLSPPPFLGSPPDMSQVPAEMGAIMHLFFGAGAPSVEGQEIKGQPASKGVVIGTARVIHDLSEADRLQQGEILVCRTTAAPWTPLFAIAGGVVTDSGGVLSHSAICAREYAIPCVVATQVATRMIPDGATIMLDGAAGIVRIEG